VFRNVSAVGPIDLVAVKGRSKLLIDVKHMYVNVNKDGQFTAAGPNLKPNQRKAGIIPLYVSSDGVCSFSSDSLAGSYAQVLNGALDATALKC
jgi:hypothetical protein